MRYVIFLLATSVLTGLGGATASAPVLGYGEQIRAGSIICRMERQGVTCTNGEGHGFFISRARQRLF